VPRKNCRSHVAYSADFSPIAMACSKFKALIRAGIPPGLNDYRP
jgi:hypothetical protein